MAIRVDIPEYMMVVWEAGKVISPCWEMYCSSVELSGWNSEDAPEMFLQIVGHVPP